MSVTRQDVFKYMFLPRLVPRVRELALNLPWLAYLMALIFTATRILPRNHPYASRTSMGTFSVQDILFEAGRHLKGGFRNTDQYLIYGSFVLGIFLLLGQFLILIFILATHTAEAAGSIQWSGMFSTPNRENDLALMMLDKVFEIPNMFGSKFNPASFDQITMFGKGLHRLFTFYNYGMLCIAGLIVCYFIIAVTLETMQTGSPFGERFAEVYVPIRLIIAIGLLLPLGYGFSAGQLLTLKLADWGSGLATNAWIILNQRAASNPLGMGAEQLLVMPKTQEVEDLIRFYALVHSCRGMYIEQYSSAQNPKEIKPYLVYRSGTSTASVEAENLSYASARQYFPNANIKITFGEKKAEYTTFPGTVKPYCGKIDVPQPYSEYAVARLIQQTYWDILKHLWISPDLRTYGERRAKTQLGRLWNTSSSQPADWPNPGTVEGQNEPGPGFYATVRNEIQSHYNELMERARNELRSLPEASMPMDREMLNRGWGGAGIWFNKIVESNGAIVSATNTMPVPSAYPPVMSALSAARGGIESVISSATRFSASQREGASMTDMLSGARLDDPSKDAAIGRFMGTTYEQLSTENTFGDGTESHDDNPIANFVHLIFGTYGLSELRGNDEIHPLAKMSALGRSIIDRSMTYLGGAMVMGGLSGLTGISDNPVAGAFGRAFGGIGEMFISFASIGIIVGVTLYYVIPFLPFLYFFFAVGRWAKSIFEALVGIPLWALAHLRIDGDGVPGQAAANGYFLLLEIFLRPILVLFGLMAAVACFSALAVALDTIFDLVVKNVTGYTPVDRNGAIAWNNMDIRRSDVDEFFYTVMYAILLYMMAMSCFKLIDLIPNSVLRFMGSSVSEFADKMEIQDTLLQTTTAASYAFGDDMGKISKAGGEIVGMTAALPMTLSRDIQAMTPPPSRTEQSSPQTQSGPEAPPSSSRPPEGGNQ